MKAILQTDVLQQKELKTLNSLNNCKVAVGLIPTSHSNERGLSLKRSVPYFLKNSNLFSPLYDWDNSFAIEQFEKRICFGKEKVKIKKVCRSCGKDFELDSQGKPVYYVHSCNSPYCRDPACMKHRQYLAYEMFMMYFNAYDQWQGRGNRWGHEVYGFKRTSKPKREDIADMKIRIRKFQVARAEKLNIRIKGIGVRDISYDVEKIGEEYYIHFHFARRPYSIEGNFNKHLEELNKLSEHYNFKYNWIGYRKAESLADYFSKRHSGQFEHKKDNSNWLFPDLFSIKDYFNIFYNARKTIQFGFSRKEIKMLKYKFEQFHKREAFVLSSNVLETAVRDTCQNCGNLEFKWVIHEEIITKPPDLTPEVLEVPIIKI